MALKGSVNHLLLHEKDACLIIQFLGDLILLEYIHLTISHTKVKIWGNHVVPGKMVPHLVSKMKTVNFQLNAFINNENKRQQQTFWCPSKTNHMRTLHVPQILSSIWLPTKVMWESREWQRRLVGQQHQSKTELTA